MQGNIVTDGLLCLIPWYLINAHFQITSNQTENVGIFFNLGYFSIISNNGDDESNCRNKSFELGSLSNTARRIGKYNFFHMFCLLSPLFYWHVKISIIKRKLSNRLLGIKHGNQGLDNYNIHIGTIEFKPVIPRPEFIGPLRL